MYRSVERVLRTFKKKIRQALEGKALCNLTCIVRLRKGKELQKWKHRLDQFGITWSAILRSFSLKIIIQLTAIEEQENGMSRGYHVTYKREAGT